MHRLRRQAHRRMDWQRNDHLGRRGIVSLATPCLTQAADIIPTRIAWTATSTANAPAARSIHTAVWTGSEMIAWGGRTLQHAALGTGGRYNPGTNSWCPRARLTHLLRGSITQQSGQELTCSSGVELPSILSLSTRPAGDTIPSTNSWTTTSAANVPIGPSFSHGRVDWE